MNNNKEAERAELHKTIWRIANDLRGSVDGWDFKSYVLGMLFYRFISENLTAYINAGEHEAGNPDFDYAPHLKPWREMIESGLTTFAENPEPTRSDCHAWSAHPILGFFQIVAGVTSLAPGWTKARIAPHPGSFSRFDARIAHPSGEVRVNFEREKLTIDTPVPATLVWRGKTEELEAGSHRI